MKKAENQPFEKILSSINDFLEPLDAIARGQKPKKYPQALYDQLKQMWRDNFLIETPASYVYRPGEVDKTLEIGEGATAPIADLKGVTSVHPISAELIARKKSLDTSAHSANLRNYKILGTDPFYRTLATQTGTFDSHDPLDICNAAPALVLTRSDIHGLRQALNILKGKLEGDKRALATKLIICDSPDAFWQPVLNYTGLSGLSGTQLDKLGIALTAFTGSPENPEQKTTTLNALRAIGPSIEQTPSPDSLNVNIAPNDTIYVCSGSSHKPAEVRDIFKAMRARVNVYALASGMEIKPREADEESRSLEGNNLEKLRSTAARIHEIGYKKVCAHLCRNTQKPKNTWLLFDDRGMEFTDWRITAAPSFDPVRQLFNPNPLKLMPGAELAPVFKAVSRRAFFKGILGNAIAHVAKQGGPAPSAAIMDTACYLMVRLDWLQDIDNIQYIASFAKARSLALTTPQPAAMATQSEAWEAPYSHNPEGTLPAELRTKAEIPNYLESSSEMAKALRTLAAMTGIDAHANLPHKCKQNFKGCAQPKTEQEKFKLASFYSLFPALNGHGIAHLSRKVSSALNGSFKLLNGKNAAYDISAHMRPPVSTFERTAEKHRQNIDAALEKMRRLYTDTDGFLLTQDSRHLKQIPGVKWLKTLMFTSLCVGKQVGDKAISTKFFGIADWGKNKSWASQMAIAEHLTKTPLLLDKLELIMTELRNPNTKQYDPKPSLKVALRGARDTYFRPSITEKEAIPKANSKPLPDDLYRVSVYCSATLDESTAACREARAFTFALANDGFALINGGGSREGMMRTTTEGVLDYRRTARMQNIPPEKQARNHVASFSCADTQEREGEWLPETDFGIVLGTIEQRMAHLQNTDSEVLLAGGIGSVQEISASLLMRAWGITPTKHRPMVIVNQAIDGVRAHDALIDMLTDDEKRTLNIHVVNNADEALNIIKASRLAMSQEPGMDQLYIPDSQNNNQRVAPSLKARLTA